MHLRQSIPLGILFLVFLSAPRPVSGQQPDWGARYHELKVLAERDFEPKKPGDPITITLTIGGDRSGHLSGISTDNIVLTTADKREVFQRSRLTPDSRKMLFAEDYADAVAREQVQKEQAEFRAKQQEQAKLQAEAERAAQDRARQEQSKMRDAEQQRVILREKLKKKTWLAGSVSCSYYNAVWEQSQETELSVYTKGLDHVYIIGGPGALKQGAVVSSATANLLTDATDRAFKWGEMAKRDGQVIEKSLLPPTNALNQRVQELKDGPLSTVEERYKKTLELAADIADGVVSAKFHSYGNGQRWNVSLEIVNYDDLDLHFKNSITLWLEPEQVSELKKALLGLPKARQELEKSVEAGGKFEY